MISEFELTREERAALRYFGVSWGESDEGGWFVYAEYGDTEHDYPGSSCEALSDVVEWYRETVGGGEAK